MSQVWGEDVLCIAWCGVEIPLKKEIDIMQQTS